jgi:predicted nucleic acid-binding protein
VASVFVDTSALYPLVVRADVDHEAARGTLERLRDENAELVTTSYVVHETVALLHRRWGVEAVRDWQVRIEPALRIVWIARDVHSAGVIALVAAASRRVSLTDWTSFEVIRREGIPRAFAFDRDFRDRGFETIPG